MVFSTDYNHVDESDIDKVFDIINKLLAGKGDSNKYIVMFNDDLHEIGSLAIIKPNSPVAILHKSNSSDPNAILFLQDDYFAILYWGDYNQHNNHDKLAIRSCVVYNDKHLADMLNNVYESRKYEKKPPPYIVERYGDRLSKSTSITIKIIDNKSFIIHYDKHDFVTEILLVNESFALKNGKMIARDEFVSIKIGNSVNDMHRTVSLHTNEYTNFDRRTHSFWKNSILTEALKIYNSYS